MLFIFLLCVNFIAMDHDNCAKCTLNSTNCISTQPNDICACLEKERNCYLNSTYNNGACFSEKHIRNLWKRDCLAAECTFCDICDYCDKQYQSCRRNSNECECLTILKKCYNGYPDDCKTKGDKLTEQICIACNATCNIGTPTKTYNDNTLDWVLFGIFAGAVGYCIISLLAMGICELCGCVPRR